jgi:hypothetical protein
MTTTEAITIFKILQDKYGSPHLIDTEIIRFLNMAQYERLNRIFPDDMGGAINVELDQNTASNVRPFIYSLSGLNTTAGVLSDSTVNAALVTASGDVSASMFRVLNVSVTPSGGSTYPARYSKHNDILTSVVNYFKAPSATNPRYTMLANGLKFYPVDNTASIALTVVKRPKTLSSSINPEWDDYNMNLILMISLQLAGVSTRDQELITDIRNIKVAN